MKLEVACKIRQLKAQIPEFQDILHSKMQAQKIQALLNFDRRLFSKYKGFEVSESRRTKSLHRKHQILPIRYRLQGDFQITERTLILIRLLEHNTTNSMPVRAETASILWIECLPIAQLENLNRNALNRGKSLCTQNRRL